jgi:hypothetical protein
MTIALRRKTRRAKNETMNLDADNDQLSPNDSGERQEFHRTAVLCAQATSASDSGCPQGGPVRF